MSGVPDAVTASIRDGAFIPDTKLSALSNFAQLMVTKRGLPDHADLEAFLSAGYEEKAILDIILAIAVKTISNYTNHIFHTEVDEAFAKHIWSD
jgi:alkylhydroperoxidase family enzyme